MTRQPDNNPRELIGKVSTSIGLIEVRMPTIGDVMLNQTPEKTGLAVIVEASISMKWEDFLKIPAPDGFAVLKMLSTAIEAMNSYINVVTNKPTSMN